MSEVFSTAIVLAAGSGSRMKSAQKKQFMELEGKPILYYTLKVMQESDVEEIVVVTAKEDIPYCEQLKESYCFSKIVCIVGGGKQRYNSVQAGLDFARGKYVLIHDGARPFVSKEKINELLANKEENAILAVPVKDTIKMVDADGKIANTPDRKTLYAAQTPQKFRTELIRRAYSLLEDDKEPISVTDDAMVMQHYLRKEVSIVEGEYSNIKITTPEDWKVAKCFLT